MSIVSDEVVAGVAIAFGVTILDVVGLCDV